LLKIFGLEIQIIRNHLSTK